MQPHGAPPGENAGPTRAVRLSDIAQSLGIAVSTVSMAIAGDPRIAEATRNAVRQKADELGFRPNPNAQRLLKGFNPGEIAVVMHDIDQGILTQIAREIRFALAEEGYRPTAPHHRLARRRDRGAGGAIRTLRHEKPEAILCFLHDARRRVAGRASPLPRRGRHARRATSTRLPLDCDQAVFDEEHGTRLRSSAWSRSATGGSGFAPTGELDPEQPPLPARSWRRWRRRGCPCRPSI